MAAEETTRFCRCDERYAARARGEFQMDLRTLRWYFPNDPPRRVADSWRSEFFGTENHDGEPYLHEECPWCGWMLPTMDLIEPPYGASPDATGGGEGEE